jgi:hypothetical protein
LEQIRKQSKELLRAFRAHESEAVRRISQNHPELGGISPGRLQAIPLQLADAQLVVAREYGFASWPKLKAEVDRICAEAGKPNAKRTQRLRRKDGRVWLEGVSNLAWGRGRENTFCGALEQALSVTDNPYSYVDLMGLSGLSFRTRWFQGNAVRMACPSSPVGEFPDELRAIGRATGWPITRGYHFDDGEKAMAPYWDEVVASVEDGLPMLTYMLRMDVGVIHGYAQEGRKVIGWDYHHTGDEPVELPIEQLGSWIAFLDANAGPQPPKEAFLDSLGIAVSNFRRDTYDTTRERGDYRYGADALSAWASDVRDTSPDLGDFHSTLFFVNWWTFNSLVDARQTASAFLRDRADLLPREAAEAVTGAAGIYDGEMGMLTRAFARRDVFLGPWSGKTIDDWTPDVRERERDMLLEAISIEERAIALLDQAVQAAT